MPAEGQVFRVRLSERPRPHRVVVDGDWAPAFAEAITVARDSGRDGMFVSGLHLDGEFLDCGRSGVSNQRSAELVRIHRCHSEDTAQQDIDFEPSGVEPGTAPRRYSIIGNTFLTADEVFADEDVVVA